MLCIGTLSGTSMNAKEFILCEINGEKIVSVEYMSEKFKEAEKVRDMVLGVTNVRTIAFIHDLVGISFAKSLRKFLKMVKKEPEVIGFHGQTVFHEEVRASGDKVGNIKALTLQVGEPSFLSVVAKAPVVYDFRKSDISAGGRGAPLSPLIHYVLFKGVAKRTCVLNLGGIANISIIDDGDFRKVRGEDVGPANAILDFVVRKKVGADYDKDGLLASQGKVIYSIFYELVSYFESVKSKSLGIEIERAKLLVDKYLQDYKTEDILRTLVEVSVSLISGRINNIKPDVVIVCGGGVRNKFVLKRLREEVKHTLCISEEFGMSPEYVEPVLFAYLAYLRISDKKIDMRSITGARFPYLPGKICKI